MRTKPGFEFEQLVSGKSLDLAVRAIRLPPSQTRKSPHQSGGGTPAGNTGQSRAVLSHEAVSTRRPSGLKTALLNRAGVALESGQELAALSLPEPRGFVIRCGEHPPAVRAKDRAINPAGVALESGQELAALSLPEPRGLVLRGGEHPPAVRAKDRALNRVGVALESGQELAALSLPEPRGLVL